MAETSSLHISVKGLHKSFSAPGGTLHVLKGINLSIEESEMIGIVGASGAGKTTFLHVLGTLETPTEGQVVINGMDLFASASESELAKYRNHSVGYVFQFHHLIPEFTAVENTMMPALIARIPRKQAIKKAMSLLERLNVADRAEHKPGELSGGEQQRVAVARALVMEPKLLLADEPTGNLDSITGEKIHDLLVELNREMGVTMIIVTHNEHLADRIPRVERMVDGVLVKEVR